MQYLPRTTAALPHLPAVPQYHSALLGQLYQLVSSEAALADDRHT